MGKRKRAVVAAISLAGALILFSGCRSSENRTVVVYASVDQVYAEPILKEYERKTGIRVLPVYDVEAAKTTGLVTRILTERRRPRADVFWSGEFAQTVLLRKQGALERYVSPTSAGRPQAYVDPEGYWSCYGGRARVFLVNTDLIPESEAPKSLSDMLDPKWPAHRVGMALPLFGTSATHAAALYAVQGPKPALAFFRSLKERGIRVVDGNSMVRDLVARGELMFGLTDTDDAFGAVQRGAPVAVVAPDMDGMGTLVVPGTVSIIRGCPHPSEARQLADELLSAVTEAALFRSGFLHVPIDDSAPTGLALPVKPMAVDLVSVVEQFPRAVAELRELFVR